MNRVDRILQIIDGGLEGQRCWRCDLEPGTGVTGLCDPCRAWMNDPSTCPEPPKSAPILLQEALDQPPPMPPITVEDWQRVEQALVEALAPFAAALGRLLEALAPVLEQVTSALKDLVGMSHRRGERPPYRFDAPPKDLRGTAAPRVVPPTHHRRRR